MSSSSPIDSAWFLLKQEDNPADYDLTQLMSEEDKTAATKYMASLSPERRKIINQIQENFANLPPDVKGQLLVFLITYFNNTKVNFLNFYHNLLTLVIK